jgi:hypothetical protein
MKDIYELQLNESYQSDNYLITRVPGGWIYERNGTIIKVDYDSEFQRNSPYTLMGVNDIIEFVRKYYDLPSDFLESRSRDGNIPIAKKMIIKILRDFHNIKQRNIAKYLKFAQRSTISNHIRSINDLIESNVQVKMEYEHILERVRNIRKC